MKDQKPQNDNHILDEEFSDLMDSEYLEMLELIEKRNRGEITEEELKKLEYIRKSREFLYGGDA